MDRKKLIAYSLMADGEYEIILKFIKKEQEIPNAFKTRADKIQNAITIFDSDYPKKLLNLRFPPFVIYYKGNKDLLKEAAISVIGSRNHTEYAEKATTLLCQSKEQVIVSGLAKGIDTIAHANAKRTIAVLGCGIDYIYPQCNLKLYKKIEKEGLIISEYPELTKPLGYHFPFRNRITAALGDELYVAEAKAISGTISTVNEALELNKPVKVLPFDIFTAMENKVINNKLINEGAMTWDIESNYEELGMEVILKHGN